MLPKEIGLLRTPLALSSVPTVSLPTPPPTSLWLNAIEPKWVHGKRKGVEPAGLLGAYERTDRVCRVFGCPHYEHLSIPQEVA